MKKNSRNVAQKLALVENCDCSFSALPALLLQRAAYSTHLILQVRGSVNNDHNIHTHELTSAGNTNVSKSILPPLLRPCMAVCISIN